MDVDRPFGRGGEQSVQAIWRHGAQRMRRHSQYGIVQRRNGRRRRVAQPQVSVEAVQEAALLRLHRGAAEPIAVFRRGDGRANGRTTGARALSPDPAAACRRIMGLLESQQLDVGIDRRDDAAPMRRAL